MKTLYYGEGKLNKAGTSFCGVLMQDLQRERIIVTGYCRSFKALSIPNYIPLIIDRWYSIELFVIFNQNNLNVWRISIDKLLLASTDCYEE